MNVEEFKKMSRHDQLFYVIFQDDGETFKDCLDIESLTGNNWAWWITVDASRIKDCPFEKLTPQDWAHVLSLHPDLAPEFLHYGKWDDFDGSDWVTLLQQPELAEYCNWNKLEFPDWRALFGFTDEFAAKCPFENFEPEEMDELLRLYPELTPYSGLNDPYLLYIVNEQPISSMADNDDIPFGILPEDKSKESAALSLLLQTVLGYSPAESYVKTAGIRRNQKSVIAVYAGDFAQHKIEPLRTALRLIRLPLRCISEPFDEHKL